MYNYLLGKNLLKKIFFLRSSSKHKVAHFGLNFDQEWGEVVIETSAFGEIRRQLHVSIVASCQISELLVPSTHTVRTGLLLKGSSGSHDPSL